MCVERDIMGSKQYIIILRFIYRDDFGVYKNRPRIVYGGSPVFVN